jgi:hypothetical protein
VKLPCERSALEVWWRNVSLRNRGVAGPGHATVCEIAK